MSVGLLFFSGWVIADLGCWFVYQCSDRIDLRYLGTLSVAALGFSMMIGAVVEFLS